MLIRSDLVRYAFYALIFGSVTGLPPSARCETDFSSHTINGQYIFSFDGAFSSAPPPFTGEVLQFSAAQVGRLAFDGAGQAWGEATLTFHHPSLPFGVRSRIALRGNYTVSPDGKLEIYIDEFPLDVNGEPGPDRTNSIIYECYIVRRLVIANCVLHSLVSFQQGLEPRALPVTMSGSLRRQRGRW